MINRRSVVAVARAGAAGPADSRGQAQAGGSSAASGGRRDPPGVAFLLSDRATVIDFCGPWEVFQDAGYPLFTVAETPEVLMTSGGMKVLPEHTYEDAPQPAIVVIGAQRTRSPATMAWLRSAHVKGAVLMSVCTGAFLLAETGLLDGRLATTHHLFYDRFAAQYPRVNLHRGERFVDNGDLASAGGLTSGIDLALHMVSRFSGLRQAGEVADYMEYQGQIWRTVGGPDAQEGAIAAKA